MRRTLHALTISALSLLSVSCSKPANVTGTVYVVTAGQGSYRLPLAPIVTLTEQQMHEVKKAFGDAIASRITALEAVIEQTRKEEPNLRIALDTTKQSLDLLLSRREEITGNPFSVIDSDVPWHDRLKGFRDSKNKLEMEMEAKREAHSNAESLIKSSQEEMDTLKNPATKAPPWLRDEFLALVATKGIELTKTDADGNFDIIPPQDTHYLICLSQRQTPNEVESYLWILDFRKEPSFSDKRKVDFNNLNLTQLTIGFQNS